MAPSGLGLPSLLRSFSLQACSSTVCYFSALPAIKVSGTPFNCYLINLVTVTLLNDVLYGPLNIVSNVYMAASGLWTATSCNIYLYSYWVLQANLGTAHMLITLNRIWAVAWPISHRLWQTRRMVIGWSTGMWVYLHVVIVPALVMDTLW